MTLQVSLKWELLTVFWNFLMCTSIHAVPDQSLFNGREVPSASVDDVWKPPVCFNLLEIYRWSCGFCYSTSSGRKKTLIKFIFRIHINRSFTFWTGCVFGDVFGTWLRSLHHHKDVCHDLGWPLSKNIPFLGLVESHKFSMDSPWSPFLWHGPGVFFSRNGIVCEGNLVLGLTVYNFDLHNGWLQDFLNLVLVSCLRPSPLVFGRTPISLLLHKD